MEAILETKTTTLTHVRRPESALTEHAFSRLMSVMIVEIRENVPVLLKRMQIRRKLASKPHDTVDYFRGEKDALATVSHISCVFRGCR